MIRYLLPAALVFLGACRADDAAPTTPATAGKDAAPTEKQTEPDVPPLAMLPRTYAPDGARVFIVSPADGASVSSPVHVEFGAQNVTIVPAGDQTPNSGHHHLIIDAGLPDENFPVPANDNYIHFGDGSTSTDIELTPGEHTLTLILGDHLHIPHKPPVFSETITITVTP